MTEEHFDFEDEIQKKKKTVVILAAALIILLCGALIIGQPWALLGTPTPQPSAVAQITSETLTTVPPPTNTGTPQPTATHTTEPPTAAATATALPTDTPTPVPTDTVPPPTATPEPPTPSPSPTPEPPTPTATLPPIVPAIENPADGSELLGEGLSVTGTAASDTTVQVYEGDSVLGEVPADETGNWTLVPEEPLADGEHTIVAVDVETGVTSLPVTFTLLEPLLPITGDEFSRLP